MYDQLPGILRLLLLSALTSVPLAAQVGTGLPQKKGLDRFVRVFDTKTGEEIGLATMVERLAGKDVVFLGESHLDETTHEVELDVYRRLIAMSGKKVILAMEMFSTADQPALDEYLAGLIDEHEFRQRARIWGNYQTGYRALIELAKAKQLRVVGSNIPRALRRKIGRGKKKAWDALSTEERALLPEQIYPNSKEYWKRFNRAVGGHMSGFDKVDDPTAAKYLYNGQCLWDNTMGWSCARALREYPGSMVVHINGGFHTSHRQGTVQQFLRRSPGAKIGTVQITGIASLSALDREEALQREKSNVLADFMVYTKKRGRGNERGMNAVHTSRRLRFKISVPKKATQNEKLPLLIWLSGDGYRAQDGLRYWKLALGNQAAVLSVEPPYPQVEEDFRLGGRWFWNESYQSDLYETMAALEEIRRYALAYWPLDKDRLLFAGIGSGATTLAAAGLYSQSLPHELLAIHPANENKLRERGIPALAPPKTKVVVFPTPERVDWWKSMIQSFNKEGFNAEVRTLEGSGDLMQQVEKQIRARLNIDNETMDGHDALQRYVLVQESKNPIAQYWALLYKRALEKRGGKVTILDTNGLEKLAKSGYQEQPPIQFMLLGFTGEAWVKRASKLVEGSKAIDIMSSAKNSIIPAATGSFGGTTILVLPKGMSDKARQDWQGVQKANPFRFQGRFYRLVLAYEDASPNLAEVLAQSKSKGRNNVLVVPAAFCMDADEMRRLKKTAGKIPEGLSISWFPGLGARIYAQAKD